MDLTGAGGIGEGIGKVADFFNNIVSRVVLDKNQAAKIGEEIALAQQSGELQLVLGQLAINKTEAESTNWFVAGWRPFVGWVCGLGLAYSFLIYPFVHVMLPSLQPLDTQTLLTCLCGMLGFGAIRMNEKINNVAR